MSVLEFFAAVVGAGIVGLNVWYWRLRARMTDDEQREIDTANRDDAQFL